MNAPSQTATSSTKPAHNSPSAFCVTPLLTLLPDQVQYYFQRMSLEDTLKYRFSDIENPQWLDVLEVIQRLGKQMYFVEEEGELLGEFTLEGFTGRAAQSHFSTSPDIDTKKRIAIGRFAAEYTLTRERPDGSGYFLDALYGLTPLVNRAACIFALKIGYKKQGILPSGIIYNGKPTDCMISVCTRESF